MRFRFFVTLVMRIILLHDGIVMRLVRSQSKAPAFEGAKPCLVRSGGRHLDARIVVPAGTTRATMLILHGIGERLSYWSAAQQFLAEHGIASLIIAYSGYGKSGGAVTPLNLRQDAVAGYAELQRLLPMSRPPFVLGLSMGTGVAIDAAPHLHPAPSGFILCEAFSSLRNAAAAVCDNSRVLRPFARRLAMLMPDLYRTASSILWVASPLLIVHSDADELFPVTMAEEIFEVAKRRPGNSAKLVLLHGYAHNDAYLRPSPGYWLPILQFIDRSIDSSDGVVE